MRPVFATILLFACSGPTTEPATSSSTDDEPVDADGDGHLAGSDCDDDNPNAWTSCSACEDADGDGAFVDCDAYVTVQEDCDDTQADAAPSLTEVCDGIDNDCDGEQDEDVMSTFAVDLDLDGFTVEVQACADPDGDTGGIAGDCDDTDGTTYPGAPEACDGYDSDCSGGIVEVTVPGDHATLQGAIDAATSGQTVCLADGTYSGSFVIDKDLRLEGSGPAQVALDGDGTGRVLDLVKGASDVTLVGLTLRNGLASSGAGLRTADPYAITTLENVDVVEARTREARCSGPASPCGGATTS